MAAVHPAFAIGLLVPVLIISGLFVVNPNDSKVLVLLEHMWVL